MALCLAAALVAPALAQPPQPPEPGLQLQDRILAVVDEDPILSSDVDRAITLGLSERREGESIRAFRRRVLESLIDQSVRLHEVNRFGIEQVPVEAIEDQVAAVRARFESEEELVRRLEEVGLDLAGLRQLVARQLSIVVYFEEFLGPRIFVDLEEIREYYEGTLVPAMEAEGTAPPPIEVVRERIRNLLKQQRLNEAIDGATEELRREADILSFFDDEHEESAAGRHGDPQLDRPPTPRSPPRPHGGKGTPPPEPPSVHASAERDRSIEERGSAGDALFPARGRRDGVWRGGQSSSGYSSWYWAWLASTLRR